MGIIGLRSSYFVWASEWILWGDYHTLWENLRNNEGTLLLTHCGLGTWYDVINLSQHYRRQAITGANINSSSVASCAIHIKSLSQETEMEAITTMHW